MAAVLAITKKSKAGALVTYLALRTFDGPNHPDGCWPSQQAIAERAGLALRTVQKHLRKLVAKGLIERKRRCGKEGRGRTTDLYTFKEPESPEHAVPTPQTKAPPLCMLVRDQGAPPVHVSQPPSEDDQGEHLGTTNAPPLVAPVRLSVQELTKNRPPPPAPPARPELSAALAELAVPEVVVVELLDFFRDNDLNGKKTEATFARQLAEAAKAQGPEPVRDALAELAEGFTLGRCPENPAKLPAYFGPILARAVAKCEVQRQTTLAAAAKQRQREEQRKLGILDDATERQLQADKAEARDKEALADFQARERFKALPADEQDTLFQDALEGIGPGARTYARKAGPLSWLIWSHVRHTMEMQRAGPDANGEADGAVGPTPVEALPGARRTPPNKTRLAFGDLPAETLMT
jgi:hypothetical protein